MESSNEDQLAEIKDRLTSMETMLAQLINGQAGLTCSVANIQLKLCSGTISKADSTTSSTTGQSVAATGNGKNKNKKGKGKNGKQAASDGGAAKSTAAVAKATTTETSGTSTSSDGTRASNPTTSGQKSGGSKTDGAPQKSKEIPALIPKLADVTEKNFAALKAPARKSVTNIVTDAVTTFVKDGFLKNEDISVYRRLALLAENTQPVARMKATLAQRYKFLMVKSLEKRQDYSEIDEKLRKLIDCCYGESVSAIKTTQAFIDSNSLNFLKADMEVPEGTVSCEIATFTRGDSNMRFVNTKPSDKIQASWKFNMQRYVGLAHGVVSAAKEVAVFADQVANMERVVKAVEAKESGTEVTDFQMGDMMFCNVQTVALFKKDVQKGYGVLMGNFVVTVSHLDVDAAEWKGKRSNLVNFKYDKTNDFQMYKVAFSSFDDAEADHKNSSLAINREKPFKVGGEAIIDGCVTKDLSGWSGMPIVGISGCVVGILAGGIKQDKGYKVVYVQPTAQTVYTSEMHGNMVLNTKENYVKWTAKSCTIATVLCTLFALSCGEPEVIDWSQKVYAHGLSSGTEFYVGRHDVESMILDAVNSTNGVYANCISIQSPAQRSYGIVAVRNQASVKEEWYVPLGAKCAPIGAKRFTTRRYLVTVVKSCGNVTKITTNLNIIDPRTSQVSTLGAQYYRQPRRKNLTTLSRPGRIAFVILHGVVEVPAGCDVFNGTTNKSVTCWVCNLPNLNTDCGDSIVEFNEYSFVSWNIRNLIGWGNAGSHYLPFSYELPSVDFTIQPCEGKQVPYETHEDTLIYYEPIFINHTLYPCSGICQMKMNSSFCVDTFQDGHECFHIKNARTYCDRENLVSYWWCRHGGDFVAAAVGIIIGLIILVVFSYFGYQKLVHWYLTGSYCFAICAGQTLNGVSHSFQVSLQSSVHTGQVTLAKHNPINYTISVASVYQSYSEHLLYRTCARRVQVQSAKVKCCDTYNTQTCGTTPWKDFKIYNQAVTLGSSAQYCKKFTGVHQLWWNGCFCADNTQLSIGRVVPSEACTHDFAEVIRPTVSGYTLNLIVTIGNGAAHNVTATVSGSYNTLINSSVGQIGLALGPITGAVSFLPTTLIRYKGSVYDYKPPSLCQGKSGLFGEVSFRALNRDGKPRFNDWCSNVDLNFRDPPGRKWTSPYTVDEDGFTNWKKSRRAMYFPLGCKMHDAKPLRFEGCNSLVANVELVVPKAAFTETIQVCEQTVEDCVIDGTYEQNGGAIAVCTLSKECPCPLISNSSITPGHFTGKNATFTFTAVERHGRLCIKPCNKNEFCKNYVLEPPPPTIVPTSHWVNGSDDGEQVVPEQLNVHGALTLGLGIGIPVLIIIIIVAALALYCYQKDQKQ